MMKEVTPPPVHREFAGSQSTAILHLSDDREPEVIINVRVMDGTTIAVSVTPLELDALERDLRSLNDQVQTIVRDRHRREHPIIPRPIRPSGTPDPALIRDVPLGTPDLPWRDNPPPHAAVGTDESILCALCGRTMDDPIHDARRWMAPMPPA